MRVYASFKIDVPEICLLDKTVEASICLHLKSPGSRRSKLAISGFPSVHDFWACAKCDEAVGSGIRNLEESVSSLEPSA